MKDAYEYERLWQSGAFEPVKPAKVKKEELIKMALIAAPIFGAGVLAGARLGWILARRSVKSPK